MTSTFTFMLALTLLLAGLGTLIYVRLRTVAAFFQQEEYDNVRFLRAWPSLSLIDIKFTLSTLLIGLLGALFSLDSLAMAALGGAAIAIAWLEWQAAKSMKKPLVMTRRVRRLLTIAGLIAATGALGLVLCINLFGAVVAMQALPATMILANLIYTPFQTRENQGYIDQAKAKLARFEGVKIAITGSFGKTTVKHALGDTLGQLSTVFYSTGSVNTLLGLTRHIRQRLQPAHRYFVAEMGAYGIGSIQRLCTLVDPDHAIITSIGLAHNERFGGLESVAQAKSELAVWAAKKGGKIVLTQDVARYAPFAAIVQQHPSQAIIVGDNATQPYHFLVSNVRTGTFGTAITLQPKNGAPIDLTLPLLGSHNADNLALIAALLLTLGWSAEALTSAIGGVRHVPHRLAPRPGPNGSTILDDAYNANPIGMRNAFQLAKDMATEKGGKAYAITPGLVELGDVHDAEHFALGQVAGQLLDKCIVVTPERVPTLVNGIRESGGVAEEAESYLAARAALDPILGDGDVLLIANDLPDLLGSRVWL